MVTELLLIERMSDSDLALLAEAAGEGGSRAQRVASLREKPEQIGRLLVRPEVFEALFVEAREDPVVVAGPFLAFAVLLGHAPSMLQGLTFVPEWVGRRRRVPVFEVEPLREFVADPLRRLFLADLLASYTHVASGAIWVRGRHRWRSQRFSELDPGQFAELILTVPPEQRLALYRRLGDLSLFLSGVFPDYVGARTLTPIAIERLRRAVADGPEAADPPESPAIAGVGSARLLEWLGQRSYWLAWNATTYRDFGFAPVLGYVADHFRHARMVLNLLTDRYLFRHRERWFPLGS